MRLHQAIAILLITLLGGCEMMQKKEPSKDQAVSLAQVSAPARATIEKQTQGGTIEKITAERERNRDVFDVEATVGGKHMEYLVAADTGELLGTEVPIDFADLPAPVRAAAEKHFGATSGLTAMKGTEYGETSYEIEGMLNGKRAEASFDAEGKPEK